MLNEEEILGLTLIETEELTDSDNDGDSLADIEEDSETEGLMLIDSDGLTLSDIEELIEGLNDSLRDELIDGDKLAEIEEDSLIEGLKDGLSLIEIEGLCEIDKDAEMLSDKLGLID
jgi:hypothetical protein